ncbi:YobI family P-loop NTPase [Brevibacterium sediminis]
MRKYLAKARAWLRRHGKKSTDGSSTLLPLTPRYEPSRHGVYLDAIETAMKSSSTPILNVALTGSYGAGKSSILEEVTRRHRRNVVSISLSTLGSSDDERSSPEMGSKTNRIQKEIVKQLLYSQDPVRMPGSRYRRITRFRFWRELGLATLLAAPLTLTFYLAKWTEALATLVSLPLEWSLLIHGLVFSGLTILIMGFQLAFHNRFQVEKITAGSATISLTAKSATYFDEYLDEIVYFFEVTKRDIVLFEDIDRFDDAHIFETLRSLNSILNGAKQLKRRRIRFIYALKDSIFDELGHRAAKEELAEVDKTPAFAGLDDAAEAEIARANRTKFFDLVIPVVPFITHRSARDLLGETMKNDKHEISAELIELAARHVADMRLIKNIRNEFVIFKHQVIDLGELELDQDKLFAMMLYKSIHLKDFELIRLGKSNLDDLYRDYRDLISTNIAELNEKNRRARKARAEVGISAEHSEVLGNALEDHIKIKLWDLFGQNIQALTVNGNTFDPAAVHSSEFWNEIATSDGALTVTSNQTNRGRRELELTRDQISEALGVTVSSKRWVDDERARLDAEIKSGLADREFLAHAGMSDLINRNEFRLKRNNENLSFLQLAKRRLKSELAIQLVSAGSIDRNFTLYTSTFYGMRTSANATNFILKNIEPNVTDMVFPLTDEDVDAIFREKGKAFLRERSAYNKSILDRIIRNEPQAATTLLTKLATYGEEERDFLLAYLEDGTSRDSLVRNLAGKWPRIFSVLIEDAQLEETTRLSLINTALRSLDRSVDYIVTDAVNKYLLRNYTGLKPFISKDTTLAEADEIAALIKKAGLELPLISMLGENILESIVRDGSYRIVRENLLTALGSKEHSLSLDLVKGTRAEVYERVLENIPDYLSTLEQNQPTIANGDAFIPVVKEVDEADRACLPEIITRAADDCRVVDLSSVPQAAWPSLSEGRRFPATFTNVRTYINGRGLDSALAGLLKDAKKVDIGDRVDEPAKLEVALSILSASQAILSARSRAELVAELSLEDYIPASDITDNSGKFVGYLITEEIVEDNAETFANIESEDISGFIFAIEKSKAFASFMTPALVAKHVISEIMGSENVPRDVKGNIVARFDEYTVEASRDTLTSVARYALEAGKSLPFDQVARLAGEGVDDGIVLSHLQFYLGSSTLAEIAPILKSLGGRYGDLTYASGRRPRITKSSASVALVNRLFELGVVSSVDQQGAQLKVNMRRH